MIPDELKSKFRNLILRWSEKNLIDYPWRRERNPYRVLISEIFLNRTRASQVIHVFNDFIKAYPTLEDFLNFNFRDIFNIVKSLGLYKRVDYLEKLSNQLKSEFNGIIPDEFDKLISLKGIGIYTANAILCFGYNKKRPLLDTNFIRIYKRIFEVYSKTKSPKTDKFLWNFSKGLLPKEKFIEFNYGILDIGGRICKPRKPKCMICPLFEICKFYKKVSS